jgi:radical SAM protein with 4Fe4S-binding SPASM domain
MDRPMSAMRFDIFKKLIDEAAELGVPELRPNGYGEILVLKNLEEYLEYISGKRHRFRVIINTNGHRLSDDKIELFIRHRTHTLNITIDGATKETAQAIRVGLSTEQIEDNIQRLMATRRKRGLAYPKVRVGMVVISQNVHEADAFLAKWNGKVDHVTLSGFSNRAGSLDSKALANAPLPPAQACTLPFSELDIWADGKAVLCCEDWNEQHVVGDIATQSVREIWQGPALNRVRELHLARRGADIELCRQCKFWRAPQAGTRLWTSPPP